MEIPLQLAYESGVGVYCDDLSPVSPPETMDMRGGTYPGEALRSRNTPFMGVIDKTARTHQYIPQPPAAGRSWAVSSLDTVVTSPATSPSNMAATHGYNQPSGLDRKSTRLNSSH